MKRFFAFALISVVLSAACGDDSSTEADVETDSKSGKADAGDGKRDNSTSDADSETTQSGGDGDAGSDAETILVEGLDGGSVPITFKGEGVECGEELCRNVAVGGDIDIEVEGCCADEQASQCGVNLEGIGALLGIRMAGCEPLDLPGSSDPSCPDSEPIANAFGPEEGLVFPGCCQPTGKCGFDTNISGIGFGCVDPERFVDQEPGEDCDYIEAQ